MKVISVSSEINQLRERFFKAVFGEAEGYVCLASRTSQQFREEFFKYPEQLPQILEYVNRAYNGADVYFCPQLLTNQKRTKGFVSTCPNVWADLDECDPSVVSPEPSIVIESSKGRWQAFWILTEPADPVDAEDASHRLAYKYANYGADQSGWDLTQLLRVPMTYNLKRHEQEVVLPKRIQEDRKYLLSVFKQIPEVPGYEWVSEPFPSDAVTSLAPESILDRYRITLDPQAHVLFTQEPREDWSKALWQLEMMLLEAGMSREECFVVAQSAKCNKFARDQRPITYLWKDVCRAYSRLQAGKPRADEIAPLLTEEERNRLEMMPETFVDRYVAWAKSRGDAAWQYHEVGAMCILSSLLSGVVRLPTSFGVIVPNLWFMILADTTLTRKSTAMDMAMELLLEVEPEAVLATDGSLEGLLQSLSTRPSRPGVFWRDEFSGLLEMIRKKDYYAGMIESLTKLYDGKYQKRVLRKEIIEIRDPILIIFCGGIRTRILNIVEQEYIISGFLPRFIFVEAKSDITQYRPIGPITEVQDNRRQLLVEELQSLYDRYSSDMIVHVGDQSVSTKRSWDVTLTEGAWDRYNEFERVMVKAGLQSSNPDVFMPTLDRLSKSGLKVATLLAAANATDGDVVVTEDVLLKAISYVEGWREYSLDVVTNAGKSMSEKQLDSISAYIRKHVDGVPRSRLMQNFHLNSRETELLLQTLDQRGLARRVKDGRAERVYPV